MARPPIDEMPRGACSPSATRLLGELGETIVAPGQMTYGSQAAAASQVFAQQRDLALRDRADQPARARRRGPRAARRRDVRGLRPLRPADRRRAARGAAVGRPLHRLPADRRPRALMTDDGDRRARSSRIDDIRAAADRLRGIAIRTPLVAVRAARAATVPQGRVAPADRRVQDPGRLRRGRVAAAATSSARGVITYSSGNHAQGVARAARLLGRPGGRRHAVGRAGHQARAGRGRRRRDRDRRARPATSASGSPSALAAERGLDDHPALRRRPDHRRPGHGRARDRRGPAGRRGGPRPDRRRRAGERRRRRRSRRSGPAARVIGVEPELAADARDSLARGEIVALAGRAGRRGRSPTGRGRRRSAGGRSRTCAPISTRSSPSPRPRSPPPSGSRPSGAGSSSSRRARWRSRRWRSTRAKLGLDPGDGPVVAVVSGGNVDPERYRDYLVAPIPPEG